MGSDPDRRRKLHVDVLPYVKTPESLPGVSTNRREYRRSVARWVSHDPPCPWTRRVKVIRHTSRYGRKELAQSHASWFWRPVCASLCDKLRLQVTCSPLNTTTLYLLLTGTAHYCKHMHTRGSESVGGFKACKIKTTEMKGWRCLSPQELFSVSTLETARP